MKARHVLLAALAGLAACRFGGPSANPEQAVTFPDASIVDAGRGPTGDDVTASPEPDGTAPPGDDGGPAGDDGGGLDAGAGDGPVSGNCAATVPVCDPVHNTGCNPFQQCDVDPLQSAPTGLCLFGAMEAGVCTSSIVSESCPPRSTCVDGGCRQLCFCNADCPVGQCCSDHSGPSGFTLCRTCP